ncbi:hypothetical protein KIN20_030537 [Parelaphostrongylus tenuis]|uniref:Uncharacterized protein n=1 Tax=Parelaphostrongylus tenuis TaxID=148309 RepID=A0AAD5R3X6_PARTN|nr:hypothetical protein KIN20_030537 [Parelaphostrongylus tenuis]
MDYAGEKLGPISKSERALSGRVMPPDTVTLDVSGTLLKSLSFCRVEILSDTIANIGTRELSDHQIAVVNGCCGSDHQVKKLYDKARGTHHRVQSAQFHIDHLPLYIVPPAFNSYNPLDAPLAKACTDHTSETSNT